MNQKLHRFAVVAAVSFASALAAAPTQALSTYQARHADLVAASRAAEGSGLPEIEAVGNPKFDKVAVRAAEGLGPAGRPSAGTGVESAEAPLGVNPFTTGLTFDSYNLLQYATTFLTASTPPDTMGAVGSQQFATIANQYYRWHSKITGLPDVALDVRSREFWPISVDPLNNGGTDPRVRFDRALDRWVLICFTSSTSNNRILIAISNGPVVTPATIWTFAYFIPGTTIGGAFDAGCFADYPTLAVDEDVLIVGTNVFRQTTACSAPNHPGNFNTAVYVLRKSDIPLAGGDVSASTYAFTDLYWSESVYSPHGADNFAVGTNQAFVIAQDGGVDTNLRLGTFSNMNGPGAPTVVWSDVTINDKNDGWNAGTRDGVPYPGIPVPNSGAVPKLWGLDPLGFRPLGGANVRNGRLWTTIGSTVEGDQGDLRLYPAEGDRHSVIFVEIDTAASAAIQDGNIFDDVTPEGGADDPDHYFMGSVMVNGQGHALAGFSIADPDDLAPSAAYAGRLATDPLSAMSNGVVYRAGGGTYDMRQFFETSTTRTTRWGDYSMVTLDPCDDMTFWTVQEYQDPTQVNYNIIPGFPPQAPGSLGGNFGLAVAQVRVPAPTAVTATTVVPGLPGQVSTVAGTGFYSTPLTGMSPSCRTDIAASTLYPGLIVTGVTFNSANQILLNLNATGALPGNATVTITNPDGQQTSVVVQLRSPANLTGSTKTWSGVNQVGGAIAYTVTVTNAGPQRQFDNAGNEFLDTLPPQLTLVSASATVGTAVAIVGPDQVSWNGSLNSGQSTIITINATVDAGTELQTVTNQGAFSYDADGNGVNETSSLTDDPGVVGTPDPTQFVVAAPATLSATKTASGNFIPGGGVIYEVIVSNAGPGQQLDNPGDEFFDQLPVEVQVVSVSATSGTATFNGGANTVSWNGAIPANGSVTITITTDLTIAVGPVSNQGVVNFDADGDGTNESSEATDDPDVIGGQDPTVINVASVLEIPTLAPIGLALLSLAIVALAFARLRRRPAAVS